MCRLAFFQTGNEDGYALRVDDVQWLLDYLVSSNGGHGNGCAVFDPDTGALLDLVKHVRMSTRRCARMIVNARATGHVALWHTRLVSIGKQCRAQCHPHEVAGPNFVGAIAHNGTWRDGAAIARWLGWSKDKPADGMSDSQCFAHLLGTIGENQMIARGLWPSSGVWLVAGQDGDARPVFEAHKDEWGALVYCPVLRAWLSELPWNNKRSGSWYTVAAGRHDMLDVPARPRKRKTPRTQWTGGAGYVSRGCVWSENDLAELPALKEYQ